MQIEEIIPAFLRGSIPGDTEEIRLRCGKPCYVMRRGRAWKTSDRAVTADEIKQVVDKASGYSVHSYQDQMRQGFLTLEGGHRIGLCGTAVLEGGEISHLRQYSSLNIRLARQVRGMAQKLLPWCRDRERVRSLLLVSPPGVGKTTCLRDLIRLLSSEGIPVGVADERSEIAAMRGGQPQFDLGEHTDVMEGCPKAQGAMMLLKTMAPRVIAMDEITCFADVEALRAIVNSGVAVLATMHAWSGEELMRKPVFACMEQERFFERYVVLRREGDVRFAGVLERGGSSEGDRRLADFGGFCPVGRGATESNEKTGFVFGADGGKLAADIRLD